jgi:hypothetical protein
LPDEGRFSSLRVRDLGQCYGYRQRVQWIRGEEHQVVDDPLGPYEIDSYLPDPDMPSGEWLRVQLRRIAGTKSDP